MSSVIPQVRCEGIVYTDVTPSFLIERLFSIDLSSKEIIRAGKREMTTIR